VASVVANQVFESQRAPHAPDAGEAQRKLNADIEALSAEGWRRQAGDG
jgi:hypothetical protein